MKIHEYQGKELFRKFGMATPRGYPCFSVDEAVEAAKKLGGKVWVVKAQIHAGGRGKGGGVKVAKSLDEVREKAKQILGMQLVTHQTGAGGCAVGSWGGQRPSLGGYVTGTGATSGMTARRRALMLAILPCDGAVSTVSASAYGG